ncbi:MAG TPA: enoyl-CoA hydratase-related protein, partial [Dongiaceae bacterium]
RPDKLNALDKAMWRRLAAAMKEVAADSGVRCVIVGGNGPAFGAGADIAEFAGERGTPAAAEAYAEIMGEALESLRACPVPTVARIHGACAGAGLEIAIHCDLRLAAASSRFGIPIQRLGIGLPYPELAALAELVGAATALEILLEGRMFDAAEAREKGLVTRVIADERLSEETRAAARRIADGAPLSHRWHKRALRRLLDPRPLSADELREGYAICGSEDYRQGIQAFLAKSRPVFGGR